MKLSLTFLVILGYLFCPLSSFSQDNNSQIKKGRWLINSNYDTNGQLVFINKVKYKRSNSTNQRYIEKRKFYNSKGKWYIKRKTIGVHGCFHSDIISFKERTRKRHTEKK